MLTSEEPFEDHPDVLFLGCLAVPDRNGRSIVSDRADQ